MTQISDDLFLGAANTNMGLDPSLGNPSPMDLGVGPMGRVYVFDILPLTKQTAGLAALQTRVGAGNLVLTAGTGVTTTLGQDLVTRYALDTARVVTLTSAGDLSAVTFTVSGYDIYGQPMSQQLIGPSGGTVSTLKAFKSVISVAASATILTNVSVGYGDTFGLPVRITDRTYIGHAGWAGVAADDPGVAVAAAADTTNPASTITGDVRGTYTPSSAANGARRLVMSLYIPAIGSGRNATRVGALGVDQGGGAPLVRGAGPAPVNLGRAAPYAIIARATTTDANPSVINGDVGLAPGTSEGIPPAEVNGTIHVNDSNVLAAQTDLQAAYLNATSRTGGTIVSEIGNLTLAPGLYTSATSIILSAGDLTLNGGPDDVWIFQAGTTFTQNTTRNMVLSGGARARNVFWQVGTSTTIGAGCLAKGSFMSAVSATIVSGAAVEGRVFAGSNGNASGAVTVDANTVSIPTL